MQEPNWKVGAQPATRRPPVWSAAWPLDVLMATQCPPGHLVLFSMLTPSWPLVALLATRCLLDFSRPLAF